MSCLSTDLSCSLLNYHIDIRFPEEILAWIYEIIPNCIRFEFFLERIFATFAWIIHHALQLSAIASFSSYLNNGIVSIYAKQL